MIKRLDDIIEELKKSEEPIVLSVAAAQDEEVMMAVKDAYEKKIIKPVLVGDEEKIRKIASNIGFCIDDVEIINKMEFRDAAEEAVRMVASGKADFVMKGILDTSIILKEVLNKEYGLRTDSLLSHVMIYELPAYKKLLLLTDGGMNISPDFEQKKSILKNSIDAAKSLGIENVKVACLAAKEKVNEKMPATVDADMLKKFSIDGGFGSGVTVEGPMAFDLAVSEEACRIKGYKSDVGGDADILLVPNIETGNGIGKSFTYMAGGKSAGIIMGAKVPVVLVSRADTHESKLYSIAYGALISKMNK